MNKTIYTKEILTPTLKMAVPSMIESFFVCLAGLIDSLMVSSLGSDAVAAVGLTSQPKFIGLAVFIAANVSVSALVARRLGEKRQKSANEILAASLTLTVVLGIAVSVAFVLLSDDIIRLCGSTPETHKYAVDYLSIIMGGMAFNCIQLAVNAAQRGAGNTKITMRTNITSNTVNVIFNYLLIGGKFGFPALGIKGAALATVLGTVVAATMSLISISKSDGFISIPYILREKIRPTLDALKSIVMIGYSVFFEQLLLRVGFLATALMAAHQGNDPMAAHQVAMNIMSLSFAFGDGLQAAAVALIGRSLGEKNPEKAKNYGKTCQLIGGIISVVLAVIYFFSAEAVMTMFFREKENIIKIGTGIVHMIIFIVLFQIRQVIYMGALRGAGDTLYTAVVSAICVTIIRTVVSYLCCYVLNYGIYGIWAGIFADQMIRYFLAMPRFKMGKWAKIKI